MTQQGTKIRRATGPLGHTNMMHWCPGCKEVHGIRIVNPDGHPIWTFNENYDLPTFHPSVRIFIQDDEDEQGNLLPAPIERTLCHYFIEQGMIKFCGDCPHELNGQTVELPDWPYNPGSYGGLDE